MTSRLRICAAVLATGTILTGCGAGSPASSPTPPPTTAPSATSASPSTPASMSPSMSASANPTGQVTVPVYWVGATRQGPRLFREFASAAPGTPGAASAAAAALGVMLTGSAADPAYDSGWPSNTTLTASGLAGLVVTVALDLHGARPLARSSLAVQQLVYTATGAQPGTRAVTIRQSSGSSTVTLHSVARAPQADVLAPIWIINPQWGATVTGPTIRVTGTAAVFEAQLAWRIRQGSQVVASGTATASIGAPDRGSWSFVTPKLSPGTYVIEAYDRSMEDGSVVAIDQAQVSVTG